MKIFRHTEEVPSHYDFWYELQPCTFGREGTIRDTKGELHYNLYKWQIEGRNSANCTRITTFNEMMVNELHRMGFKLK